MPAAVKVGLGSAWAEPRCHAKVRNRRILVIAGRSGEGSLTEPTAALPPWQREPLTFADCPSTPARSGVNGQTDRARRDLQRDMGAAAGTRAPPGAIGARLPRRGSGIMAAATSANLTAVVAPISAVPVSRQFPSASSVDAVVARVGEACRRCCAAFRPSLLTCPSRLIRLDQGRPGDAPYRFGGSALLYRAGVNVDPFR